MVSVVNFLNGTISPAGQEMSVDKKNAKHFFQARGKALAHLPFALIAPVSYGAFTTGKFLLGGAGAIVTVPFSRKTSKRCATWFVENGKQTLYSVPVALLSIPAVAAPELTTRVTADCFRKELNIEDGDEWEVESFNFSTGEEETREYAFDIDTCKYK